MSIVTLLPKKGERKKREKGVEKGKPAEVPGRGKAMKLADLWITIGVSLAVSISWSVNRSIMWAALHGSCSWAYVTYYAIWG